MGGKGGFGRQLRKMGKEFRVQRDIARKQKARSVAAAAAAASTTTTTTKQRDQQSTTTAVAAASAGKKKPFRRTNLFNVPLEGVYRDVNGKRIVLVDNMTTKMREEEERLQQEQQRRDEANADHVAAAVDDDDSAFKKQEVELAAREAIADERRDLVKKIIAAAREGVSRITLRK